MRHISLFGLQPHLRERKVGVTIDGDVIVVVAKEKEKKWSQ